MRKLFINFVLMGLTSVLVGCSGSSDSGSGNSGDSIQSTVDAVAGSGAIQSASKVSVVEPKTSSSSSRSAAAIDVASFSASTDYSNDTTSYYVYEEAADALQTVNGILCQIGQSRPDLMLNEGNYKAQIDEKKCNEGQGSDSKGGNAPTYVTWTANASREENQPMIGKVWVPNDEDGDGTAEGTIQAKMTIYQPPGDTYPLGFFNLNFRAVNNSTGEENFKGYMRTLKKGSTNILQFYQPYTYQGTTVQYSVSVEMNADDSGKGTTQSPEWGQSGPSGTATYNFAYNEDYFYKQKKGGNPVCLDRNDYYESAWRYGLYDSSGNRVDINSGFPIKTTVSGTDYFGYIGYYGLWMPSEASVSDGGTVKKLDFSNPDSAGTDYTVKIYGGKLYKHTKQEVTLDDIKNIPLSWQDQSDSYKEKRVYWDGTGLKYDATRGNDTDWQWEELDSPASLTLNSFNAPYGFWFWSQALGGDGRFMLTYDSNNNPTAPTGSTKAIFHTREPIFPGDSVPSTLTCFNRCPNYNNLGSGSEWGSPSVYQTDIWIDNVTGSLGYTYSFSTNPTTGMVLKDSSSNEIIFDPSNQNLQWGLFTGELFVDNATNRQAMACDGDNSTVCTWKAREALSTFYSWETGKEDWQKLTLLVDGSGTPVKFDPPMVVNYTHSGTTSNSGKNFDGGKFYLEYGGFGDLWGIPYFCTDKNGNRASCGYDTRHVNEFVIPAGKTVTKVGGGDASVSSGTEFVVKPLEVEQAMKEVTASTCSGAGLSLGGVSLPDSSGYTAPGIGDKPTVSGPPAIVGGSKKVN
jgi:hypothetical protein